MIRIILFLLFLFSAGNTFATCIVGAGASFVTTFTAYSFDAYGVAIGGGLPQTRTTPAGDSYALVQSDGCTSALPNTVYPQGVTITCTGMYECTQSGTTLLCPDGSRAPSNDTNLCPVPPVDPVAPSQYVCNNGTIVGNPYDCVSSNPASNADIVPNLVRMHDLQKLTIDAINYIGKNITQQLAKFDSAAVVSAVSAASNTTVSAIQNSASQITTGINSEIQIVRDRITSATSAITNALLGVTDNIIDSRIQAHDDSTVLHNDNDIISSKITSLNNSVIASSANGAVNNQLLLDNLPPSLTALQSIQASNTQIADLISQSLNQVAPSPTIVVQSDPDLISSIGTIGPSVDSLSTGLRGSISQLGTDITAMGAAIGAAIAGMPGAVVADYTAITDSLSTLSADLRGATQQAGYGVEGQIQDTNALIDDFTTQAAGFFSGEQSTWSDKGTAALSEVRGDNPLATPDEKDVSTIIKTTVSGGAACPSNATADVMGHTIEFSYQPLCDWADIVGKFIMIIAAFISIRIIAGGF